ncbi:PF13754 domain-containing protein [Haloimpatiens massiliensis]|uniref:PF13754 domain-containing protein n=1 Tax=Haloimpatiens massiliensis TaxID=1658110 RepID=UPI0011AF5247|nr:PF13754 domain-containing protein [Haloimpatiens massiliensis]
MRLIGYLDGVEISFDFYPPNVFKATIPKSVKGTYIVQLKAIDNAGNETNQADIYMFIDFQKMIFRKLDSKYICKHENSEFVCVKLKNNYYYRELW